MEQHFNEVDVEHLQLAGATIKDRHLGSRARRDMRELEGDLAVAHEHNPARQLG